MKVLASWLQEYLDKPMPAKEMAEHLEHAGVEVEEIISSIKLDTKVIVGLVKKVIQHPNADRLRLAEVDTGHGTTRLVCGAPNLAVGQKVALAQVGATLPDGTELKKADIRGETSNGMLCSPRELGISDEHEGILVLEPSAKMGTPVADIVGQGETLDLTTAANRSDLQSVIGLAREIAAMSGAKLKMPPMRELTSAGKALKAKVEAPDVVGRYMLQAFELDQSHGTAEWAKQRLIASGTRPINLSVDVTNYVLHEFGQPLHAFDADKVKLPISVRMAKKGEKITTLDGVERTLTAQDLVIADKAGPIALAGVMGGQRTAVMDNTKRIIVESATFDGAAVRKTAVSQGLRTEASARFERGLPVRLAAVGLQRAADVLAAAAQATAISPVYDSLKKLPSLVDVSMRTDRLNSFLGMSVTPKQAKTALERLGFVAHEDEGVFTVEVPWWRTDVVIEEDLFEEVGRFLGYDELPATLPAWHPKTVNFDRRQAKIWDLKAALRSLGLFEVVTYSFVSAEQIEGSGYDLSDHLKLKNPLSSEQAYLRSSLLPSLLSVAARNSRYSTDFGIFELSRVFDAPKDRSQLPGEPTHVAILRRSDFAGVRQALDLVAALLHLTLSVKADDVVGLHPRRAATVNLHGDVIGVIGEVHPTIAKRQKLSGPVSYLELDLDVLIAAAREAKYRPISKYPSITRDVAAVVDEEVTWAELQHSLKDFEAAYLSEYHGDDLPQGKKSVALRLTFSSMERTLTDAEAEEALAEAVGILEKQFKASLRA